MYITKASFHEEKLPFETYIPAVADKLIMGTFPTKESLRKYDFFYPNTSNPFWNILCGLSGGELQFFEGEGAVVERKAILDQLKLGITNIGAKIYRQNESSLDSNIFPVVFTDVFQLLDDYPRIKTLVITSSTKGNSVLSWFRAYCELNQVALESSRKKKVPWETNIALKNGRQVKILVIYSTSGAAVIDEQERKNMYANAILKNKI
jgi:G:T/U-mismatch repair DNA glycosylase